MAYDIRWLREDEWAQCLDLLAEVMDANRGYFSDSFKRMGASVSSLVLVADGEIASHIRIFDRGRRVGDCLIRSAEVGDVCTHPRHRGRGYMTALLNVAAQFLYLRGFNISSVYSGVPIYQKAGWVAFPEPEQYLLWRLINIKSLFSRTVPVFQAREEAEPILPRDHCDLVLRAAGFPRIHQGLAAAAGPLALARSAARSRSAHFLPDADGPRHAGGAGPAQSPEAVHRGRRKWWPRCSRRRGRISDSRIHRRGTKGAENDGIARALLR